MNSEITLSKALKESQLVGALESICQNLELTKTQREIATSRYETVGKWLDSSQSPALMAARIYPQGSMALETTVKPAQQEEFDVDLVCLLAGLTTAISASSVKALIGNRLRENGHYSDILEEKPRCWRLNYANEFHLDITPSIPNHACHLGGEFVPDKKLNAWKPSNPKGYKRWFDERAALEPAIKLYTPRSLELKCEVESLPGPTRFKGILRRIVQLCKRHRDLWAQRTGTDCAPISIILTTLAARSYKSCVTNNSYDTEFSLLLDVVLQMPSFIEKAPMGNRIHYFVWNDTTSGENFAEKWNEDHRLAQAFYVWQQAALAELNGLTGLTGMHNVRASLSQYFGEHVVSRAMSDIVSEVGDARNSGRLSVTSTAGVSTGVARSAARVRSNTFYGI